MTEELYYEQFTGDVITEDDDGYKPGVCERCEKYSDELNHYFGEWICFECGRLEAYADAVWGGYG